MESWIKRAVYARYCRTLNIALNSTYVSRDFVNLQGVLELASSSSCNSLVFGQRPLVIPPAFHTEWNSHNSSRCSGFMRRLFRRHIGLILIINCSISHQRFVAPHFLQGHFFLEFHYLSSPIIISRDFSDTLYMRNSRVVSKWWCTGANFPWPSLLPVTFSSAVLLPSINIQQVLLRFAA